MPQKTSQIFNANQLPPQNIEAEKSTLGAILLDKEEIDQILDQAEQKLFSISQKSTQSSFAHIGGPIIKEAFERLDRLHKGDGKLRGHSTGFYALDGYRG